MGMAYGWCSHCLAFCRMALEGAFITCSGCGKVLGEVSVKTATSNMKRKSTRRRRRFKTTKRLIKRHTFSASASAAT
ncbi:hypothetical protein COLO4_25302 [Corchorus olitorius]|uniref:Uncharacterized protein n=1 Tax=Corchorus olitorius TaxID=93759 RepID=A0A1R3I3L3_9ROSI|nr:hypothetical protein COLO4_25302 [Corchorus olitorius]